MTAADLLALRLHNQKLSSAKLKTAADVVTWLGCVQSQDYAGARWAVGQRMASATAADIDREFDTGTILRIHVLRPTWHFVAPADLRWILGLSAPRVHGFNASYYRRNELDAATLARARRVIERALGDQTFLTRTELAARLKVARIPAEGERLAYIMMHAELDAVICSGPRRGKQFTYALVDERAPRAKRLRRDEALAELSHRYFTSHGPATARDFAWWSGLTLGDARRGVEMLGKDLVRERVVGCDYCWRPASSRSPRAIPGALLLPNYDEALIAYKDRTLSVDLGRASRMGLRGADTFIHHLLIDGHLAGSWRPGMTKGETVEFATYARLARLEQRDLDREIERYATYAGRTSQVRRRRA